jgi:hypothetical protein
MAIWAVDTGEMIFERAATQGFVNDQFNQGTRWAASLSPDGRWGVVPAGADQLQGATCLPTGWARRPPLCPPRSRWGPAVGSRRRRVRMTCVERMPVSADASRVATISDPGQTHESLVSIHVQDRLQAVGDGLSDRGSTA